MIIDNGRLETEPGVKIAGVIILGMEDNPPLQFQRAEIAESKQLCRQVDFHEIAGSIRLGQKLPERRIMRCGGTVFLLHRPRV